MEYKVDIKLPTAKEMAERTKTLLNKNARSMLIRISEELNDTCNSSILVMISEEEEKVSDIVIKKLESLGYKVIHEKGFWEDRPCGGYAKGRLRISW